MTDNLITKVNLKAERGWTDGLIKTFLPTADEQRKNPIYKKAAPMQLYRVDRVEVVEATAEFKAALKNVERRRNHANKAVATKRQQTAEWIAALEKPTLESAERNALYQQAAAHYNALWSARDSYGKFASLSSDIDFLDRITVNFIRHQLTDYERTLIDSRGRVGAVDARRAIKCFILQSIGEVYSWLADECDRQIESVDSHT